MAYRVSTPRAAVVPAVIVLIFIVVLVSSARSAAPVVTVIVVIVFMPGLCVRILAGKLAAEVTEVQKISATAATAGWLSVLLLLLHRLRLGRQRVEARQIEINQRIHGCASPDALGRSFDLTQHKTNAARCLRFLHLGRLSGVRTTPPRTRHYYSTRKRTQKRKQN